MATSLCIGLELPALSAWASTDGRSARSPDVDAAWHAAAGAVAEGVTCVWFSDSGAGDGPACDPCAIAAAWAVQRGDALAGVVATFPRTRAPGVLARELTSLDVLSDGGAAVLLRWAGEDVHACAYLAEALEVCRAVFSQPDPVFEGRYVHVAGAVNRPAPSQPAGPPIAVDLGSLRPDAPAVVTSPASLRRIVDGAAALVCSGTAEHVRAWRKELDELSSGSPTPALVHRYRASGTVAPGAPDAIRDAGADGVVVAVPPERMPSGARDDGLARAVGEWIAPWLR